MTSLGRNDAVKCHAIHSIFRYVSVSESECSCLYSVNGQGPSVSYNIGLHFKVFVTVKEVSELSECGIVRIFS